MARNRVSNPWDFIPVNEDTRFNFPRGMGVSGGKGRKNPQGVIRQSSVVRPPKDKTSGFKKKITT